MAYAMETAFDASALLYDGWESPLFLLAPTLAGAYMILKPRRFYTLLRFGGRGTTKSILRGRVRKALSWFVFIFAAFWMIVIFAVTYSVHRRAAAMLQAGDYDVLEGVVTDFAPSPEPRTAEVFIVKGRRFTYREIDRTGGFRTTARRGGPMRRGLYVRIAHAGNVILRLQIGRWRP